MKPFSPSARPATFRPCRLAPPCVIATLLACVGCSSSPTTDTVTPSVTVQVAHPQRGTISARVLSDAVLSPLAQAAIAPRISAPVRHFYVQRGDHVRAGQLLAALENSDLRAVALDTQGTYTAAEASFDSTRGALVPDELVRSRLDADQARATRDLDASIVASRQKLFSQGAIPGRDLDVAQATLVQAQAAYDIAAQHLASLEAVSRKATLEQSQGTLQSAKGKYLGARAQVAYSQIRTPIAGVVTDRPLFAGETAAAGAALITVMDTSSLLAKIHLAQSSAQQLKVGDTASVTVPGLNHPVAAQVSLISPALDPGSTTLEVWLRLSNRDGALKVGTPVHAEVSGPPFADAIIIPAAALLPAPDGSKYVLVAAKDGTAHKRAVKVGIAENDSVQILSGLSTTDTIVTQGGYGLDDGTKIQTAPAAKSAPGGDAE